MTEEQQKQVEDRFVNELAELLQKYEIKHRANPIRDHTIRFTLAREVWQLLGSIFTAPQEQPADVASGEGNEATCSSTSDP
jgi:hypothetical protein